MATSAPTCITGLAFTAALFTAGQAPAAAQNEPPAVVLHVDNYAGLPPALLARAQDEASRIYAEAGISTIWLEGEQEWAAIREGARHYRVLLLCREMSERKIASDGIPPNVLGRAAHAAGRAYIFIGRVMDHGSRRRRDSALVLGRVLAHEIGHLVLPIRGHSSTGIMRSELDLGARGADGFTSTEREVMRLTLNTQP